MGEGRHLTTQKWENGGLDTHTEIVVADIACNQICYFQANHGWIGRNSSNNRAKEGNRSIREVAKYLTDLLHIKQKLTSLESKNREMAVSKGIWI